MYCFSSFVLFICLSCLAMASHRFCNLPVIVLFVLFWMCMMQVEVSLTKWDHHTSVCVSVNLNIFYDIQHIAVVHSPYVTLYLDIVHERTDVPFILSLSSYHSMNSLTRLYSYTFFVSLQKIYFIISTIWLA